MEEQHDSGTSEPPTIYLHVHKQRIVGVAVMERISQAYPVITFAHASTNININMNDNNNAARRARATDAAMERSTVARRATLGVAQLWVHSKHRRRGIAKEMLDVARSSMVFGTVLVPVERVAFSSPTTAGYGLAVAYYKAEGGCDRPVLVYDSSVA